jgi:hypothetical protein
MSEILAITLVTLMGLHVIGSCVKEDPYLLIFGIIIFPVGLIHGVRVICDICGINDY